MSEEKTRNEATAAPSDPPASPAGERPEGADSRSLKSESPATGGNDRWLVLGVCIFLAAIVWAVFGQTLGHEFVRYDDELYVYENRIVQKGLTWEGFRWAFTHIVVSNWHPLTMMSHMLDCQLYGLNPGGHHLTNVLLHTASAILLFLVLRRMLGLRPEKGIGAATPPTGVLWRSAFVAAVFAIHPLRVESVAWVAERKDVLSGLFFMLTLWAYARHAQCVTGPEIAIRAPVMSRFTFHVSRFYWLVLLFFALGLMCKPMLVTLPLVLLLLDYWPLGRVSRLHSVPARQAVGECQVSGPDSPVTPHVSRFMFHVSRLAPQIGPLLLEKLPMFGLALASCVVTIFAQNEAIQSFEKLSLPSRVGNALISYVAYLGQMFWPTGLAVLYPFKTGGVEVSKVVLSLVLLAGITAGVFVLRRRCPFFLTGWLWYLIMLAPVIGIVQVGSQARADRYTYLPQIGLYVLLTWAAAELCAGWRHRCAVLGGGATVVLAALIFCARTQTAYWRDSETLWTHTLACTSDNLIAHNNLGDDLLQKGDVDGAMVHFQTALQINPDYADAHYNFGIALIKKSNVDEAMVHFQIALQIKPDFADAHDNLGNALLQKGNVDEAIVHYQTALQIKPDYADAHNNLGNALLQKGNVDEAIVQYQTALQIKPASAEACYNLGNALLQKGNVDEAIVHFQKALQINPDDSDACYHLGNALLQKGNVAEAITRYQKTLQIKPDSVDVLNNLAWLLATSPDARIRDGVQAVQYAGRACELTHYGVTILVGTLSAAYAEAGRFDDAMAAAEKACALATAAGERDLLEKNRKLLALYRARQPYHEAAEKVVPAAPQP
jgi:tetratricopeptide (TPR) repeat protein